MSRTVLVPKNSPVLGDPSTRVLNTYADGTALVETDFRSREDRPSDEAKFPSGLKLPGATAEQCDAARKRFRSSTGPFDEIDRPVTAYVEFVGPPDPRWLSKLSALGLRVLAYHPENSYQCYGPANAFRAALTQVVTSENTPAILQVTELTSDLKPRVARPSEDRVDVVLLVVGAADQVAKIRAEIQSIPSVEMLDEVGHDVLGPDRIRFRARVRREGLDVLLKLPQVLSIERFSPRRAEDEVAGLILAGQYDSSFRPSGSYLAWLRGHGIDGRGVAIGIVDGGVHASHPAFAGRIRDLTGGMKDWHATMVAGHAAGNYLSETDSEGRIYGLGMAPGAELLSQDNSLTATKLCEQTVTQTGPGGSPGLIQNNSWGTETRSPMNYGSDEAIYDGLVRNANPSAPLPSPLTICFSSGNQGPDGLTRPKAAKNVIVTGNSENYRPEVAGASADNIREVYSGSHGSSYGNCGDGRIRPHVVAPGEWTASAGYDSHPGQDEYISPLLTWGGGSSGASPKTAGACALLTQWWRQTHDGLTPSPAILRALIVNGAEPIATGGPAPNTRQGWGRLHLQNILDPTVARVLVDQTMMVSHPLEVREWRVRAADPTRPVKITLAWTDPPGPVGSGGTPDQSPVVNKLALRAEIGGQTYRGVADRFKNGFSQSEDAFGAGGAAEASDNIQCIFLQPATAAGSIRVTVTALNVTTNCLTGGFDLPQQDFALVIWNARLDATEASSTVVVAVDPNRSAAPPPTGTGANYWSSEPGNTDEYLDGSPSPATPAPSPTGTPKSPPAVAPPLLPPSSLDDDAWWDEAAPATRPESERTHDLSAAGNDRELSGGLDDGFGLLTAVEHQAEQLPVWRKSAIAAIKARLDAHRADPATAARPLHAALVVGPGTRVTVNDVLALRAVAAAGGLTLVSSSPDVLAFLALRVGNPAGIRYRLAIESEELPDLVRDALAEAGGLQQVIVAGPTTRGPVHTYRFDVVPSDKAIIAQSRFGGAAAPRSVRLTRPVVPELVWTPASAPTTAITFRDGVLRILDTSPQRTAGTWTLEVETIAAELPPTVTVWSHGGPVISIYPEEVTPISEANRGESRSMVRIAGDPGTNLEQATIAPPRVAAPGALKKQEKPRAVSVRTRRSRLDRSDAPDDEFDRTQLTSPVLAQVLTLPTTATAATIFDLPVEVRGTEAGQNHFARRVRGNIVRLVPRTDWQTAGTADFAPVRYVRGQIAEIVRQAGGVVGVRITRSSTSRVVNVDSPVLAAALADRVLLGGTFTFAISGTRLIAVYRQFFDAAISALPGDHGIEEAVRVPAPRKEAGTTDYPDATRFVPAASFRAATDRAVNRIVIHITDGGPGIAGPISWFQNPDSGVSAHYIVGQDGEVVQMVRDRDIAWHANGANADSIGIEHCARAPRAHGPNDAGLMPTPIQYEASAALVRWLCEQYGIPIDRDHVLGHAEADPRTTHRNCPIAVWDWDYYMSILTTDTSQMPPNDETVRPHSNGTYHGE